MTPRSLLSHPDGFPSYLDGDGTFLDLLYASSQKVTLSVPSPNLPRVAFQESSASWWPGAGVALLLRSYCASMLYYLSFGMVQPGAWYGSPLLTILNLPSWAALSSNGISALTGASTCSLRPAYLRQSLLCSAILLCHEKSLSIRLK
jgi:hypothetical protein